jgi:7 transmembrane sweet-taste receptor of 3 GCPR
MMGLAVCQVANETLFITGEDFYSGILKTNFEGITGPVILNQTTGSRLSNTTSYSILNFVDVQVFNGSENEEETIRFEPVLTHYYSFENYRKNASITSGWVRVKNYTFNLGTSGLPPSIPPPPDHARYISEGVKIFAYILYALLLLSTLGCVSWTWYHRETRVVKASQPFFLNLLCGGIVLVGKSFLCSKSMQEIGPGLSLVLYLATTIVTMVIDHRNVGIRGNSIACNATMWMASLGLGIVFSALFAKTYRINQITKSAKKFRRIKITVRETMISVNAVVLGKVVSSPSSPTFMTMKDK